MIMKELAQASSSRVFLKKILELQYHKKQKVNLSDFSRRAGFSSRSYLSEFIGGKKGLSRDAINKIKLALRAPPVYKQFFELLALRDFPDLENKRMPITKIEQKILEIRARITADPISVTAPKNVEKLVGKPIVFKVFAALGRVGVGSTLATILERTRLPKQVVLDALDLLLEQNVISLSEDRYLPGNSTFDFLGLNQEQGLVELTKDVGENIRRNATEIVKTPSNLLNYTAFSINGSELENFKIRLREAIFSVIDEFQSEEGDTVRTVFVSSN